MRHVLFTGTRPSQAALTAATPVADRSGTLVASELPDGQGHVGHWDVLDAPNPITSKTLRG